jgi:hypothetical protein
MELDLVGRGFVIKCYAANPKSMHRVRLNEGVRTLFSDGHLCGAFPSDSQ